MPAHRKYDSPAQRQAAYRARQAAAHDELMASKGLPALPSIPTVPGQRRWQALVQAAQKMLETAHQEMQDYYDERSESWQDCEKGEAFLERLDTVSDVIDSLDELDY